MEGVGNAVVLSLAWFAAVNAVVSAVAWLLSGLATQPYKPRTAGTLLCLRLMPAGVSLLFVAAVFAPVHWRFEPRGMDESFGVMLYVLAATGGALILRTAYRVAAVAHAGWRLRACEALPRIASEQAEPTGVYEVRGLIGVSLAGLLRPRILVGPEVRATLTDAELQAAVAHELAHRAALDNLKRCAMFCAPDMFGHTAAARRLEQRWSAAVEWQADARAVQGDASRAVHLASALVKVARLTTSSTAWVSPAWSTLHDAPLLESRVRRLLGGRAPSAECPSWQRTVAIAMIVVVGAIAVGAAGGRSLHLLTESLAHLLP